VAVPPHAQQIITTLWWFGMCARQRCARKTLRATPLLRNDGASYFQEWNLRSIYRAN